ncbi:putative dynactin arp1 p62 subunit ro2 [Erysiphe necator]|uniref:Dynactin subunit 4 n=1 Tax=Uncinula necator TaxID=52586 RepID=A0A0B1P196_UNCNE|nr:putative dynactin arp1 p62 subunit ro2 [Erysiphe necator]
MTTFKHYTYIQCPCSESRLSQSISLSKRLSTIDISDDEDEHTFDPRAPRSKYSLYPLEYLLYCEDCRQIRCPRCVLDEIVTWYCPNCLFEVPSSTVKSEGNRCTRSCFQCPICIAPLSVTSLEPPSDGLRVDSAPPHGPFILNCAFCMWTTKEIGIKFEKQNGIFAQLSKMNGAGATNITAKNRRKDLHKRQTVLADMKVISVEDEESHVDSSLNLDPESQFSSLKSFYQSQLAELTPSGPLGFGSDFGFGSPGTLSRIMGLYTGGSLIDEISNAKVSVMREARHATEGLQIFEHTQADDKKIINRLFSEGWQSTSSCAQRREITNLNKRFLSDLKPIAYLLRTKRSKRCRACRQILSKPDAKVQSTRYRIRMVASSYVPSINIKPLHPSSQPLLIPFKPFQFLLICKNPLFEKIKVTLAAPSETPSKNCSKTTILCPQFEVGANTDVWDAALQGEDGNKNTMNDIRRGKIELSEGQQQAEAGKIWERGRNWVSVVLEVIPSDCKVDEKSVEETDLRTEDEDLLEIPVFVRVEWETDLAQDESSSINALSKTGGIKETRELAYWCVLGLGRVRKS